MEKCEELISKFIFRYLLYLYLRRNEDENRMRIME